MSAVCARRQVHELVPLDVVEFEEGTRGHVPAPELPEHFGGMFAPAGRQEAFPEPASNKIIKISNE